METDQIDVHEIVNQIIQFKAENHPSALALDCLIETLGLIPENNLSEKSFIVNEGNRLEILLVHKNDQLRIIQIVVIEDLFKITTCFMKDSFNYQLKGKKFEKQELKSFYQTYLNSVFGKGFMKEIHFRKDKPFECKMSFDNQLLRNRRYISVKDLIFKNLLGLKTQSIEKYRYISFLETYDQDVVNEYY